MNDALEMLEASVAMHRAARGENDWQTARAESALGACQVRSNRVEEARALLTRSLDVLRSERGNDAIETQDARHRVERLGP